MSEWHSVPSTRAEKIPPNDLDKQGAFTSIVREPTQNSTDNCLDEDQPVRIKFSLKLVDAAPIKASYLPQSIWLNHVTTSPFYSENSDRARQAEEAAELWDTDDLIPVLLIEDYNTTGLVGDIELYQHDPQNTPEDQQANTFYWLLRTLGMSAPTTGRGGSWGLGKLAFPLASRLKTFFAVTSRPDPDERLLLGQALLEYRKDRFEDAQWWDKMLYFADGFDNDAEHHWKPISNVNEINDFCDAFEVTREETEYGTSFIIPYPRNSAIDPVDDISKLMCGVVNNYALAIMQNKLVLEFENEDGNIHTIDKDNFRDKIDGDEFDWNSIEKKRRSKINSSYSTKDKMLKVLDLYSVMETDDAGDQEDCEEFELPQLEGGNQLSTRFDDIMPDSESDDFIRLKEGYDNGKFIKIRHTVPVVNSDESITEGLVEMVFQLCEAGNVDAAEAHYYRSQISLPLVNGKEPLRPGLASLVMIAREEPDDLSEMLRQSEGPAHLNWEPDADRLERYRLAHSTVNYIKQLPELIVSRLSSTAAEGVELWQDLFSFGGDEGDTDDGDDDDDDDDPPVINRDFTIIELPTNNGFSVTRRDIADSLVGNSYLLRIGYPKPLPLKWDRAPDTRLTDAVGDLSTWQSSGCRVETIQHVGSGTNYPDKVKLTVQDDNFKLIVNTLESRKKSRLKLEDYVDKAAAPVVGFTLATVALADITIGEDN
jgi:hypothetical protein